ncbi:MAG: VOC family protein [Bacteroidota bacterium]
MNDFKINFLDHVAICVKDIEASANWYEKVLGLTRYQFEEWGEYPIFMLSGKSGVAIFPALTKNEKSDPTSKNIRIDHFAFNVDNDNFEKAKKKLNELEIFFEQQNHHFFESIYIDDPDGHCVELTTLLVDEKTFYAPELDV